MVSEGGVGGLVDGWVGVGAWGLGGAGEMGVGVVE